LKPRRAAVTYNRTVRKFAQALIAWQRRHGRHDLPWQGTRDPYRVWLSEVMLQQTQVATVVPYYRRFLARFPNLRALARAAEDDVLRVWSGLGYYARGRNLHRAARHVENDLRGRFPCTPEGIAALPGLGRSSAGAVAVFAFGRRAAILDGNVKRVLARCYGVEGYPGERRVEARLWALAERLLPERAIRVYTQALMDLGAAICTRVRPRCEACPLEARCVARRQGREAELPTPRPRIAQPTRRASWLVLLDGDRVLLERRPPSGLWGGLWVFPALQAGDVEAHCRREFGCEIALPRRLPRIEHGFTHFRLIATPVLCAVRALTPSARAPGRQWLPVSRALSEAVPTPVRGLLERLAAQGLRD
jgi:A/G-specific adenine glycosylase